MSTVKTQLDILAVTSHKMNQVLADELGGVAADLTRWLREAGFIDEHHHIEFQITPTLVIDDGPGVDIEPNPDPEDDPADTAIVGRQNTALEWRCMTVQQRRVLATDGIQFMGIDERGRPVVKGKQGAWGGVATWALKKDGDPIDVTGEVK